MEKVQVLMSTYNGEAYIEEQLQSLLNQSYPNVAILIRDDGSKDKTSSIIRSYVELYPDKIRFIQGKNVGVVQSFFELLYASDASASYYCFCDQDDVWMKDKIERAIQQLRSCERAGMYFTSTQMVDRELNPIKVWPESPNRAPSLYNALYQNIAVGATVTLNKIARDLLISQHVNTQHILMHDWWAYMCVSAFGDMIYDDKPLIYYRQHGNNVDGGNTSLFKKFHKKWKSLTKHQNKKLLKQQAEEFARLYSDQLDADKLHQLQLFIQPRPTLRHRIQYLRSTKLYRQSWAENQLFKFLILIDHI